MSGFQYSSGGINISRARRKRLRLRLLSHNNNSDLYDMPETGDIKTSLKILDHGSWFKLDGRLVSSLPLAARNKAISLGYSVNLPDSSDSYLRSGVDIGYIVGVNSITLNRNQLPNVTLPVTGSTSTDGTHTHDVPGEHLGTAGPGQPDLGYEGSAGHLSGLVSRGMTPGGAHSHNIVGASTQSINGGVTQQAIDLYPKGFVVNFFVWLA